jgi:hypothetical protein
VARNHLSESSDTIDNVKISLDLILYLLGGVQLSVDTREPSDNVKVSPANSPRMAVSLL